jgi:uncharacterized protein YjbI with pentapeptide repeats
MVRMVRVSGRIGRWFTSARRHARVGAVVIGAVVVAGVAWVVGPGAAWWLDHVDNVHGLSGKDLASALDTIRGRALAVGTGLLALVAVYYTARNADTARQGHVTDRYTKAIEQLGSDKLDIRLGGIYALERIARDSARDHPAVMEVLSAFFREHSRDEDARTDDGFPLRADLQAALRVIGRRNPLRDTDPINLVRADLRGVSERGIDLSNAILPGTDLTRASLPRANLSGANLNKAKLAGAQLTVAQLTKARLAGADLSNTNLHYADLRGADLTQANLSGANLHGANLRDAVLSKADLTDADLVYADLRGAAGMVNLTVADTRGARGLPLTKFVVPEKNDETADEPEPTADQLYATAIDGGSHPDFRIPSATELILLGDPRGADVLADIARDTSLYPVDRGNAAKVLIRHADPRGAELVSEVLQSQEAWLQERLDEHALPPTKLLRWAWRTLTGVGRKPAEQPPRIPAADHPDTLAIRHEIAVAQGDDDDAAGAAAALEQLLPDLIRTLGPGHPQTLSAHSNLAHFRGKAGDAITAVASLTELLAHMRQVLGEDHPDTINTQDLLTYWQAGPDGPSDQQRSQPSQ